MSYIDVIVNGPIGSIPDGGTSGQVLVKQSELVFDYDCEKVAW